MEQLLEILEDIKGNVNYMEEDKLVDDRILDSFSILTLVAELEDAFDIEIPYSEIKPDNFNSAQGLWDMVQRLSEED